MERRVPTIEELSHHPGILEFPYFAMVPIEKLHVANYNARTGRGYQRPPRDRLVATIAAGYDPSRAGAIAVAERPDHTLMIVDGQQRYLGGKRAGLTMMPCMITRTNGDITVEAWLYVRLNTGPVKGTPFEIYVADLKEKDSVSSQVDKIVKQLGYHVMEKGNGSAANSITCVRKMCSWAARDLEVFEHGMIAASKIYDGACIDNRILNGLCTLEEHLRRIASATGSTAESILDDRNLEKFVEKGEAGIFRAMSACTTFDTGNNSSKPQANGLIKILNTHRRDNNRIPFIP